MLPCGALCQPAPTRLAAGEHESWHAPRGTRAKGLRCCRCPARSSTPLTTRRCTPRPGRWCLDSSVSSAERRGDMAQRSAGRVHGMHLAAAASATRCRIVPTPRAEPRQLVWEATHHRDAWPGERRKADGHAAQAAQRGDEGRRLRRASAQRAHEQRRRKEAGAPRLSVHALRLQRHAPPARHCGATSRCSSAALVVPVCARRRGVLDVQEKRRVPRAAKSPPGRCRSGTARHGPGAAGPPLLKKRARGAPSALTRSVRCCAASEARTTSVSSQQPGGDNEHKPR